MLCGLLAFLVLGVEPADTAARTDPGIQSALDAVTTETFDPDRPAATFPKDFAVVMGYSPTAATGPKGNRILVKETGECSAFSGELKYAFGPVCQEHDLAYDLLRYSAAVDRPLPAAGRRQADQMFRRELHNNCSYSAWTGLDLAVCHVWAESFAQAVEFNSWRQGYRPPAIDESVLRWQACVVLFAVLITARRQLDRQSAGPDQLVVLAYRR